VFRDAALVAGKDLRVEARSRVSLNQVAPFALLMLFLFAFALDPDRGLLTRLTPGLFWVAVLFCALLAIQRSFSMEAADGNRDALRLAGLEPGGIFLGKAAAVAAVLLALEVVLAVGVAVLYGATSGADALGWVLIAMTCVAATAGIAAAGTLYGVLASGLRVRDTLLPLLLLPVLAPVLIGSTRAFEAALSSTNGDGWPWLGLLTVFAVLYIAAGVFAFGPLLEES
jgi:heme exporter protein B